MSPKILKILLAIVIVLLALNLFASLRMESPRFAIAGGGGGQIACSSDGRCVYLVSGHIVFRSDDFGESFKKVGRGFSL